MAGKVFQRVGSAKVGRSVFNLSHEVKLTCDMGELVPVMNMEVVPGDVISIGHELVMRMQPLVAPVLHEINAYIHTFFVPNRILWDDWEDFITGGADGTSAPTLPTWTPTDTTIGSLWDYFGFPTGIVPNTKPVDFPKRAYNQIYNDFYRDETLITEVDITTSEDVLTRAWAKDRFTSALPWQQRGTAPALPVSGTTSAVWVGSPSGTTVGMNMVSAVSQPSTIDQTTATLNNNTVDLSSATTFDISDLRLAFQVQRWLERNARAGARYTEFLKAHFGAFPRDDRLDRPEYIGGMKAPLIISEVLQTSESNNTPQGTLAGHGITVDKRFTGKYRVTEFGVIVSVLSIMPKAVYSQGVNREWIKETKYDYFFPEFAHLSETAITNQEIYAQGTSADDSVFGYQGRYDELRVKQSYYAGDMRSTFDYWHIGRQFSSLPALNQTFIECVPRKDIFAVPSEDGFIVNIGNIIKAVRPMPITAEPGLIDHV